MPNTLSDTLSQAVSLGFATSSQASQVMSQRQYMDSQRSILLPSHQGTPVAAAQNQIFIGTDINDLTTQVQTAYPGAVMYAEDPLTNTPVPIS